MFYRRKTASTTSTIILFIFMISAQLYYGCNASAVACVVSLAVFAVITYGFDIWKIDDGLSESGLAMILYLFVVILILWCAAVEWDFYITNGDIYHGPNEFVMGILIARNNILSPILLGERYCRYGSYVLYMEVYYALLFVISVVCGLIFSLIIISGRHPGDSLKRRKIDSINPLTIMVLAFLVIGASCLMPFDLASENICNETFKTRLLLANYLIYRRMWPFGIILYFSFMSIGLCWAIVISVVHFFGDQYASPNRGKQ